MFRGAAGIRDVAAPVGEYLAERIDPVTGIRDAIRTGGVMARVDVSEGWNAGGHASGVQAGLNRFLREWGMRVVGEQPGEIHARQGRWPARILGPRLSPAGWLPALAVVRFESGSSGVAVRATIGEASPADALSPSAEAKYRDYFVRWMAALKARLR